MCDIQFRLSSFTQKIMCDSYGSELIITQKKLTGRVVTARVVNRWNASLELVFTYLHIIKIDDLKRRFQL